MTDPIRMAAKRSLREAIARNAYDRGEVRIVDLDLAGCDWLVTSHRAIFAVGSGGAKPVLHGWFFGICRHQDRLYIFENCGHREPDSAQGRVIRLDIVGKRIGAPHVLINGLHNNCHQLRVIDDLLCVVDTAHQAIRRFTLDGAVVDVQRPFPAAPPADQTGAYVHINTIARVGSRIGLILHNGKALPERNSEIVWLDESWSVVERHFLPGRHCHDIVADDVGRLWHSLSSAGDVIRSDGRLIHVTDDKMTRGIALRPDTMAVGIMAVGPRHLRGTLSGGIALFDRDTYRPRCEIDLPAAPADILAI